MTERSKRGREFYMNNYNCAESTWLGLNEDLPEECLNFGLHLAGGFGGGVCTGKVCGAIVGAVLTLGRHYGRNAGEPRTDILKEKVQKLMAFVEAEYHAVDCDDLRPRENNKPFCAELVERVVEYTEKLISE